ncbi:hypothetical protein XfCFBP8356_003955 [Xylella fastidiosa subsp. sandyi]|uniref:hypothetical protein n=1 Tax=Xylella fastidiosa TaxID=2371 RepID=UPI0007081A5D|nr:hypothetical protein [Xylella fastidiosa]KQH74620.1 hypothetical protein AOT81_02010 [Xylella fastidiosa]RWA45264.1 hypothetical protein XfCFBP8356_01940 [Xylella fastidiosa subsp. sandyi]WNY19739.1 hypothetical protein RO839_03680 [Xylella fastidiosa]WNY22034.1 hypothetical protein RO838_03705 [Xylella fastidiosa]
MHTPLFIESDGNTWNFEITQELTKELACLIEVVYRIRDLPSDKGDSDGTAVVNISMADSRMRIDAYAVLANYYC